MSHRTKSGQKRTRFERKQRLKRRINRKREALIAAGHVKKGVAPVSQAAQS